MINRLTNIKNNNKVNKNKNICIDIIKYKYF